MGLLLASCGSPNVNINADVGSVTTVSQTESTVTEVIQTQSKSTEAITLPEETVITQTENQVQTDYAATKAVEKTEKQIVTQKTQGATKTKTAASKKAHVHKYSAATCTSPKKCTRCGKTDPDSLPVGLEKLKVIDSKYYEYKSNVFTDSYGNKYDGVHFYHDLYNCCNGADRLPRSIFNLNGKYKNFSGSIVAAESTESRWTYYVNIYVDDELKLSKTGISKLSAKIDFNINVKNGSLLKIKVGCSNGQGSCFRHEVAIVNAKLTK